MPSTSFDAGVRWSEITALLKGLFPKWEPTPEQAHIWKRSLCEKNIEWVKEAISLHYSEQRYREPSLPMVLKAFRGLRDSGRKHNEQAAPLNAQAAEDRRTHANESDACFLYLMQQDPAALAKAKKLAVAKLGLAPQPSDDIEVWSEMLRRAVRFEMQDGFISKLKGRSNKLEAAAVAERTT